MNLDDRVTRLDGPLDREGGNGGAFAFTARRLGPAIGLERLGLSVYVVPPGKRAFPYHAHAAIEEVVVVLEGEGTLRHEGRERPVRAGDVIAAPVGEAHQLVNSSQADLRYLVLANQADTDVVHYPDSDKVLAWAAAFPEHPRHITRRSDATDYYAGEDEAPG